MNQPKEYNISQLNSRLGTRQNLYKMLSQVYVLPSFTSHACTLQYLLKYTEEPVTIYTCDVKGTEIFKPRYKRANALELFDQLENL